MLTKQQKQDIAEELTSGLDLELDDLDLSADEKIEALQEVIEVLIDIQNGIE